MSDISLNDIKNIIKRCLIMVILITTAFIIIVNYTENKEIEERKKYIINEQEQRAGMINLLIDNTFEGFYEDLILFKNSDEFNDYINKNNDIKEVEEMFIRATSNKKRIKEIMLIDVSFKELIRVHEEDGKVKLNNEYELQEKSYNQDYIDTSKLNDNEVHISKMSLRYYNNVKGPYKPTIKISTPVFDDNNEYKGIVSILYDSQEILDIFKEYLSQNRYKFLEYSLLSSDGYYLADENKDKTFGFLINDRKKHNLALENPNLWNNIYENKVYEDGSKVYHSVRLDNFLDNNKENENYWILSSQFDINDFSIVKDNLIFNMNKRQIIIILLLNILIIFLIIMKYISEKNKSQLGLAENIAKNTNDAVIITDRDNIITYVNKAYEKITGYSKNEVIGCTPGDFKSGKQKKEFYKKMWRDINKKGYFRSELWDMRKDGVFYPKDLSIYKIKNKLNKKDFKYIGIFTDLTDIKKDQKYINKLKDYNVDTNLPNENLLFKLINNSISKKTDNFFVVYLSIENYNTIVLNSNERLENNLKVFIDRINTILDKKNFIAHISKSKFVIGLSTFNTINEVDNFMNKLINMSKMSYFIKNAELNFDIKAGISYYPDHGKNANELLVNSNIALERAILENGKYYLYFDESFKNDIQKEQTVKMMLNKAIKYDEFSINYQPQIDSRNNKIVGAEALLRWNTKKHGFISPAIFIPIAERTGQIIEIGYWVIDRVFSEYKSFKEDIKEGTRISINISPIQFNDENFIKRIKEAIIKNKVDIKYFEIEITENLLLNDLKKMNKKLKELKEIGFTIAVDDFGTGYSSLSYINTLNIDKLKIDRAFIKDYPEKDNGLVADIITTMSHKLNLDVIAEGVETIEQVDYLREKGCHFIQGYYYSKPLNTSDFKEYLKE